MLSPLYLFAVALGLAFLFGLFDRIGRAVSMALLYGALAFFVLISGSWLLHLLGGAAPVLIQTAGFPPPFAIALRMGVEEALVTLFANVAALLGAIYLGRRLKSGPVTGIVLYLLVVMGVNGMVLTRDVFNLFVFIEITSISTYALLGMQRNGASLASGFKYIMAGGIASTLFLIGVIYIYRVSGTLYLDGIIQSGTLFAGGVGFLAFFLLLASILVELKPFPANGWALDVYQSGHTGLAALIAAVNSAGFLFAFYKLLPVLPETVLPTLVGLGLFTFFFANLIGLRHTDARRILGFSSVAQVGLVGAAAAFGRLTGFGAVVTLVVVGGLFLNHLVAKAGLFWTAGILGPKGSQAPSAGSPVAKLPAPFIAAFGLLIIGLIGLPPFPGFWAKWQLVVRLVSGGNWIWLGMLLSGSLFEAIYLLRWFGTTVAVRRAASAASVTPSPIAGVIGAGMGAGFAGATLAPAVHADEKARTMAATPLFTPAPKGVELDDAESEGSPAKCGALILGAILLAVTGAVMTLLSGDFALVQMLPVAAAAVLFILDFLPGKLKGVLALAIIAVTAYLIVPSLSGLRWYFELIFLVGGGVILISSLSRKGRQTGYYPLATMLVLSLGSIAAAVTALDFIFAWELMAVSSYLLVLRGDRTGKPSLRYAAFSIGGAFLLMTGFAAAAAALPAAVREVPAVVAAAGGQAVSWLSSLVSGLSLSGLTAGISIDSLLGIGNAAGSALSGAVAAGGSAPGLVLAAMILLALGFLMKAGAIGVHVWLPGAYGEAEDDASALISGVMSKAALFAVMLFVGLLGLRAAGVTGGPLANGAISVAAALPEIVAWVGILTALFGALMAVFQEDVKYLMAYSSMSQIGYMIAGVGMMTHLGWTASMFMAVNHLLYKGMLFLAIAGVIERTGTRSMYRMGGLIKKMPVSYISALIGIIALSGVPPLPGFGGKWLFYTALLEKGWYLMAGVAFFTSTVAFLYLFRFIYTVFLGQLKTRFQQLKEASVWLLIPQVLLIIGTIAIAAFPSIILTPIMNIVSGFFPATVRWENYTVISTLGYWNGSLVMLVTMGVFITPLVWLLLVSRKPQVVKQFNMVYAGERPDRPETTHYAHNFFQPYSRALGFLVKPVFVRFWNAVNEGVHSIAKAFDNLYSGNGQTYALHILLYVVIVYFIMRGSL